MYGRGSQTPGLGFGPPVTPPIVKQLMIANAVVFGLQHLFVGFNSWFMATPALVWQQGFLWQPFSYMWLHGGIMHLAMNMFMLWMFGSQVAMFWGAKRFLRYYLMCGFGAGLIIVTWPYIALGIGMTSQAPLVVPTLGASGAIYGVLLAYSLTWPDRTIMLIFPPVAFRAIWLIPGLFIMTMMGPSGGGISHVGHLGGVLVGWILMRRQGHGGQILSVGQLRSRWHRYRMRQRLRAVRYEESRKRKSRHDDKTLH